MNIFRITIIIFFLLATAGCSTTLDPPRLTQKTYDFLAKEPVRCRNLGKDNYAGCIDEEANPGRECLIYVLGGHLSSRVDESCVAKEYPECYNRSTNKVSQKCIGGIADLKNKKRQELEEKKRRDLNEAKLEREETIAKTQKAQAEYKRSPNGIAERKKLEADYKKIVKSCNYFLSDILSKKTLKEASVFDAVETMPNVVMCTYQATIPGVYVDIPTIITITGNTQNGVYEYLQPR